jgi:short-subunit dehydrogenase
VLVSRTASKLEAVSAAVRQSRSGIRTETLAMDFAANRDADYDKLAALLRDKDISVLINNVGQSHSIPVPFSETPEVEMNNIITINCTATLRVTQLVLPAMVQRKRGLILTMGSFGGLLPIPLLATYSGSKAFLQQWSSALASELEPSGITVHFVHSYLVTSAMSKIRRSSLFVPSERNFVRSVLAKIGRRGGSIGYAYSGSPYWSHGLMVAGIISVLGVYSEWLAGINRKGGEGKGKGQERVMIWRHLHGRRVGHMVNTAGFKSITLCTWVCGLSQYRGSTFADSRSGIQALPCKERGQKEACGCASSQRRRLLRLAHLSASCQTLQLQ